MQDPQSLESDMAETEMVISAGDHVVLVAVDASDHSVYALKYYLNHLHQSNHFVIFHHTFEPPQVTYGIGAAGVAQVSSLNSRQWQEMFNKETEAVMKLREEVKATLAHTHKEVRHAFEFESHCGNKPGEGIVKSAEEHHVDLIVIGTRGHGTLRQTVLGSVSNYVLHHVECPITVCHLPKEMRHKRHDKHHHKKHGH
ncbi:universal stress protein YxiE-like [Lineus longissimus]|uniref:universal stress protein YxiE-like n=1 Tax=Lineus longissimus TaxID=88925 RepID=UPI002B4F3180